MPGWRHKPLERTGGAGIAETWGSASRAYDYRAHRLRLLDLITFFTVAATRSGWEDRARHRGGESGEQDPQRHGAGLHPRVIAFEDLRQRIGGGKLSAGCFRSGTRLPRQDGDVIQIPSTSGLPAALSERRQSVCLHGSVSAGRGGP